MRIRTIRDSHGWKRQTILLACFAVTTVCAQELTPEPIEFSSLSYVTPYASMKSGATFERKANPAVGTEELGYFGWNAQHSGFLEYYHDSPVPMDTDYGVNGKLYLRIYTDQVGGAQALGVRVRSGEGEIFHFPAEGQFKPGEWSEFVVDIRQSTEKGHWGGENTGVLREPLRLAGYTLYVNEAAPKGGVYISDVAWIPDGETQKKFESPKPPATTSASKMNADSNVAKSLFDIRYGNADLIRPFNSQKTGATFAVRSETSDNDVSALVLGWSWDHERFLEYYFSSDVAFPGDTSGQPEGSLILHVCTDNPDVIWSIGVRIKDASGEIYDFSQKTSLSSGWQNFTIELGPKNFKAHWGGANSGSFTGPLLLSGFALLINPEGGDGSVMIDSMEWLRTGGNQASTSQKRTSNLDPTSRYALEEAHLFEPPWSGHTIHGESVVLLDGLNGALADGTLLFRPESILRVRSSDGSIEYKERRDFTVDYMGRRIVLTPDSRIPSLSREELFQPAGAKRAIAHKAGDPSVYLLYAERWFPKRQVEVDYTTTERWPGEAPGFAGKQLPKTIGKLQQAKAINLCVTGDSISAGANASSAIAPYMPPYPVLLQRALEQAYDAKVSLTNVSVGGDTAAEGLAKIQSVIEADPDLVIIAYGMNDTSRKNPQQYAEQVRDMIDAVRAAKPDVEFLLVSSSMANPLWSWSPASQFLPYRDALLELRGEGIAVADVTTLWQTLMERKRYLDLTGNGINHPNDYGHRLYAQWLLGMLVEPSLSHAPEFVRN